MSRGAKKGERRGGRVKGTPNKDTRNLWAICERMNFNPFEALVQFAQTGGLEADENLRFNAAKEVAQYILPKRKAIEHSGHISPELAEAADELQDMSKDEQIKLLEDQLKELKK